MNKGASVAKLYSYTVPLKSDLLNTYCVLQKGFTDQFVYYRKDRPQRYLGLGRCIAIASREDLDHVLQGEVALPTIMFSFNRFDASNPKPADEMMQAFPRLRLMIPEVVLCTREGSSVFFVMRTTRRCANDVRFAIRWYPIVMRRGKKRCDPRSLLLRLGA